MTHEEKVKRWLGPEKLGVEIGAFKYPVPGIKPYYVDCFTEFGFERVDADYYGHASYLPFRNNSLDYVVASHVLEHVANPIAALAEWYRVLRPGGLIYLVVPDRRFTWDHPRALTSVDHLIQDFVTKTTAVDATHIDDFAFGIDWSKFDPAAPAHEVGRRRQELAEGLHVSVAGGEQINIHFHVFEPSNVVELIQRLRQPNRGVPRFSWKLVDQAERFPRLAANGFLAVIQVQKSWRDRLHASWNDLIARSEKVPVLRDDALSFEEFRKTCRGIGGVR